MLYYNSLVCPASLYPGCVTSQALCLLAPTHVVITVNNRSYGQHQYGKKLSYMNSEMTYQHVIEEIRVRKTNPHP